MNKYHVCLYEVGVVPGTQVVCYHEAGELVRAEVFIGEEGGVHLVSAEEQAPINVGGNHYGDVAEVVGAEGDSQEHH